jgi:multisubunit Na+/H+ antiporter MnhE subunit
MRFSLHTHFGPAATIAGVLVLWLLLAGEATPATFVDGLAVAIAVMLWVRLIDR